MKDNQLSPYAYVQMLRGICYGILTVDDLRQVAIRYGLSDEERSELEDRLQREGVHLLTPEEKEELLPKIRKFHGVEMPPVMLSTVPDERFTNVLNNEPLLEQHFPEVYARFKTAWESRFASDALAVKVYALKRSGKSLDEMAQSLEISQNDVLRAEETIVMTYRTVYQSILAPHLHRRSHTKRRRIEDYYT